MAGGTALDHGPSPHGTAQCGLCEIRWHGRGGQGAISSAQMLAQAAYYAGFRGVTSAPTFGAERRGAPVTASTRLSPTPLRFFSQVVSPDIVIVLDDTLMECADATGGLKPHGWLIINTEKTPEQLALSGDLRIATVDATRIAIENDLEVAGSVIVNTAMLGAFARATGMVTMENIGEAIGHKFAPALAKRNFEAARMTFEQTTVGAYGNT